MYTRVTVLMRTGQPRYFRAAGIEWRDVSTFEGGGAHGKGPWLVVIGESGEVVAELLKDSIRGFEIAEVEDGVMREEMILSGLLVDPRYEEEDLTP